jgi:hypothetical protein
MEGNKCHLSFEDAELALARLVGSRVSVRVVERVHPERLIAVYEGVLREPSAEKSPSGFWPLDDGLGPRDAAAERFGLVLHPDAFDGAEARVGGEILIVTQGSVLVNVRRL